MTQQQIEDLAKQIADSIRSGLDITSIFVPAGAAWMVIGRAVASVVPDLASTVTGWIEGNPPTEEELAEFKRKLAVLTDPNNP